jgi:hypothetical protein
VTAGRLPAFLPLSPEDIAADDLGRAIASRDAAVRDLLAAHKAFDEAGIPRRVGRRPGTVEARIRALTAAVEMSRGVRESLVMLGREA